ncbi:5-hydroxytryptamine receptor 3A-like [Mugil cephalus]|uniref:5-hydroxytryptamine receptor 3A-like n=1 Tax=Mugil cephalus TaxID=48193 RepID=UPI001FB57548|nr:5-hydroxytryptamine receptor 3A-like [Mugil cephalus]
MDRPVSDHKDPTYVHIYMAVRTILDVKETAQTLVTYIWLYMEWNNDFIGWKPRDFCGLRSIFIPKETLWMPDITIEEMIETDKSPPNPYLEIFYHGDVFIKTEQVVISTCRIRVYKFPFDTQRCNISFKSNMYSDEEISLMYYENNEWITNHTRKLISTQYEWTFIKMTVINETIDSFGPNQTRIVYTIHTERRSVLYIANFMLPVFFFLCLDLASFLISDTGGEKLGYKITVLLAVTVMQLILNDILPSSSNRIPLIVIYCMGSFSLMLLSLLETILVMHLIEKDSATQDNETDGEQTPKRRCWNKQVNSFREIKQCIRCVSVSDISADETPSVTKEGSSCQLMNVLLALEKVSDELGEIEQTVSQLSTGKEEGKPGYWTRLAKKINRIFSICYVTAVFLFVAGILLAWLV